MNKGYRGERGSITVFTLASCLFFLVSVMGVQAYTKNKQMSVEDDYKRIKQNYEVEVNNQDEIYNKYKDVTISENGVTFEAQEGYIIPTGATACTISQRFTVETEPNNRVQSISYAWNNAPDTQPLENAWQNLSIQSLTHTVSKNDATQGSYYLWVKVKREASNDVTAVQGREITVSSDGITIVNTDSNAVITYPVSVSLYNKKIGQGETEFEAKSRLQNDTSTTTPISSNVIYVEATDSHGNKIHKGYTPVEFATTNGRIDVVWVDTNNNVISSPLNVSNYLSGMSKIAWDSSNNEITPANNSAWYNYTAGQNKWANAKNPDDGSYFVWIPRYAYRITYLNDQNKPSGYFDGRGMVDLAGNIITSANGATFTPRATSIIKNGTQTSIMATVLDDGVNVVEKNGYQYIVHPAFETNLDLGGWSSDLPGFWCAKFEMSREDSSDSGVSWSNTTDTGNVLTKNAGNSDYIRAVSRPNVPSWRGINIANCYTNSYYYDRNKESHLMKNSEWGAVAYLSYSQFGRDGQEIIINNNNAHETGRAAKTVNASGASVSSTYSYNQIDNGNPAGELASSTGNIYGIYDLSGGAWDLVAAFNKNYSGDYFTNESYKDNNSKHFASYNGLSTKYATAYSGTGNVQGTDIYIVGVIGDATKEVFTNIKLDDNYRNWFTDYSMFLSNHPFLERGGNFVDTSAAGIFSSFRSSGYIAANASFRIVLIL